MASNKVEQAVDSALADFEIWQEENRGKSIDEFIDANAIAEGVAQGLKAHLQREIRFHAAFQNTPGIGQDESAVREKTPEFIDRYQLVGKLGEGGMGTVWLAEQQEPVRRQVALKVIRPGFDSDQFIKRFDSERQLLALMDHPHIARVLDAGTTSQLVPYLVMEYVLGIPITEYCENADLTFREKLDLFMELCGAIQHAHNKGIIHRDIKPSNVLVSEVDGQPSVKVIDFGLAKALESCESEPSHLTKSLVAIGTPLWMSPEQADGRPTTGLTDVDTRADVYSLGALLYQLLTGTTPIDPSKAAMASPIEMIRLVKEYEPARPSARIQQNELAPSDSKSSPNLHDISRNLITDLDWIVLKAIEKDRERRYETVNQLLDDLKRLFKNEPVSARPPSTAYRIQKFARKHRIAVSFAALVVVLLTAGLVGTSIGLIKARIAEDEATAAKDLEFKRAEGERLANENAQKRLKQIEKGNKILTEIFTDLDIEKTQSGVEPLPAVLAKRLLSAAKDISGEAIGDPLIVANLQVRLGKSILRLGYPQDAIGLYRQAVATREKLLGENHVDTLVAMDGLGVCLETNGDYEESIRLVQRIVQLKTNKFGEKAEKTLYSLHNLAGCYRKNGNVLQAISLLEQIFEICQDTLPEDHKDRLVYAAGLASVYGDCGRYDDATKLLTDTLRIQERKLGKSHFERLDTLLGLAILYKTTGDYGESKKLLNEMFSIRMKKLGPNHPNTLIVEGNIAGVLQKEGRYQEGIQILERISQAANQTLGASHPVSITILNNLAVFCSEMGDYQRAKSLRIQTKQLNQLRYGKDHPATLACEKELAVSYRVEGDYQTALEIEDKVLSIRLKQLGELNPSTIDSWDGKANTLLAIGEYQEAIAIFSKLLNHFQSNLGEAHVETLVCQTNLASALLGNDEPDKALSLLQKAYQTSSEERGLMHPSTLKIQGSLATAYKETGRFQEALKLYQIVLENLKSKLGENHLDTLVVMGNLANCRQSMGQLPDAISLMKETNRRMVSKLGPDHPHSLTSAVSLAGAYRRIGNTRASVDLLSEYVEKSRERYGENHAQTLSVKHWYGKSLLAHGKTNRRAKEIDKAQEIFENVVENRKTLIGEFHPDTMSSMSELARVFEAKGQIDKAIELYKKVWDRKKQHPGATHVDTLVSLNNLAGAYWRKKDLKHSIPLFENAAKQLEKRYGKSHPETLIAKANLGVNYRDAKRYSEGISLLEEVAAESGRFPAKLGWVSGDLRTAYIQGNKTKKFDEMAKLQLSAARKQYPPESMPLVGFLAMLGEGYTILEQFKQAEELLLECHEILTKKSPKSWRTFYVKTMLGNVFMKQNDLDEAKNFLVDGYQGLELNANSIPIRARQKYLTTTAELLIQLSKLRNEKEDEERWRKKLMELTR